MSSIGWVKGLGYDGFVKEETRSGVHGVPVISVWSPSAIPGIGMRSGGPGRHNITPKGCPAWLGAHDLGNSQVGHNIWKGGWVHKKNPFGVVCRGVVQSCHVLLKCMLVKWIISGKLQVYVAPPFSKNCDSIFYLCKKWHSDI